MNFSNLFFFETMLTPKIITIVYWLMLVFAVLAGLGSMLYTGFQYMTFGSFLRSVAITVGGAVAARIWCELLIVFFKINENVQKISNSK